MVETVQMKLDVEQEDQAHIDEMVAKAEGTEAPVESTEEQTEELILGKFKTQEDLVRSYQELEKKLGEPKPETKEETKPDTLKAEPSSTDNVDPLGLSEVQKEYEDTGDISEETINKLVSKGIPKQFIDSHIEGVRAAAQVFETKAYEATGGQENYKAMQDWIVNNLPESERNLFNDGVSGNSELALYTIKNMYARFNADNKEPNIQLGETNVSGSGVKYESMAQMKADMRDPRYNTDPAFRKEVADKISRSDI